MTAITIAAATPAIMASTVRSRQAQAAIARLSQL